MTPLVVKKRKHRIGPLIVGILCLSSGASANESYVCVASGAAGFALNKSNDVWDRTYFDASQTKYVLSSKGDGSYGVSELGQQGDVATCSGFNGYRLDCVGLLRAFEFNSNTLR